MKSETSTVKFGDLASSISITHRFDKEKLVFLNTSDIFLGKLLHRSYSEIKNWPGQAKKSVQKNDILFSEIRPANGRWAFIDEDASDIVVSTKLMVIRAKTDQVCAKFLYHFLTSKNITGWLQHLAESRSGTFPQITFDQVASLDIPSLELPQQREISDLVDALEYRIDYNRSLAANLEAIARRLFKSWFVDFDPVYAKADGENPSCMSDDIAALFPDRFVDSELREIPDGWKVGVLGDACELNPETWSTRKHPETLEYIDLSNVKSGGIEDVTSYLWDESPSRARRVLRYGDTIVGTVRPGNRSFALITTDGLTGSTGFAVLRPSHPHHREYLYLAATADDAIERLAHLADGAAYPAVRPDVVTSAEVVIPNDEIMRQFSVITSPMFDQIAACQSEASVLSSLRDLLLPRLFSGKLRVADAESLIEEAIA